jgi:aminoglycoside phosphotransferase (APT) family kinase protein
MKPPSPFVASEAAAAQDWQGLRAYLDRHGMTLDLAEPPRQFAGGLANYNYLVNIDGADCVLRRPPANRVPGGNDMGREYGITSRLWQGFPLAPRAFHFCQDEQVIGAPFLLMEYRPGMVIGGRLPDWRPVSPEERQGLGRTLIEVLAGLHGVDAAAVGLQDLGKPDGMLARMVDGWEKRAHAAWEDDTPAGIGRTAQWLRARLPARQQEPTLLHSDFKLDNLIVDPVSLAPRAVIDWDMGTRGDPLVDLATLMSYWTEAGDPQVMHDLAQMPTAEPGFPTRAELAEDYARRTGADLSALPFYRVLCLFKLTVVFMQLHARYRRGEITTERYRSFGPLSLGLLDFTEATAAHPVI